MLVEILCGGYGCRTKTGIHTVMRGEQCEVSESEARRLIGLGVAKSPYITDRGTASTLAAAPATAEGNATPPQPKPSRAALGRPTLTPTSCRT